MCATILFVLALASAAAFAAPTMRTGNVRYVWQYTLPLDRAGPLGPTEEVNYRLFPDGSSYGVPGGWRFRAGAAAGARGRSGRARGGGLDGG